jgi:hypothetical protein
VPVKRIGTIRFFPPSSNTANSSTRNPLAEQCGGSRDAHQLLPLPRAYCIALSRSSERQEIMSSALDKPELPGGQPTHSGEFRAREGVGDQQERKREAGHPDWQRLVGTTLMRVGDPVRVLATAVHE